MAAKPTTRKAPASAAPAKKAPAKKVVAKKVAVKKVAVKKVAVKKAVARKAPANKAVARKAPAKKAVARKAPANKAAVKKPRLDKAFLDAQKSMLVEERAKYLRSATNLQAEADLLLESRDPGDVQFDEESGEGDTLAVERDLDLALSAQARDAVEEIDAALERIRRGVYGVCVTSRQAIPKERLKAIPWAAERVEVKAGGLGRR